MLDLKRLILCVILKSHDWTSNAEQGIKPTKEQLERGVEGFEDYATMWCRRCPATVRGLGAVT